MKVATLVDGRGVVVEGESCRPLACGSVAALLEGGDATLGAAEPFDAGAVLAPLPRTHTFLDGSAYVNHVELVRRARGANMPDSFWTDPLMYQGCAVFDAPNAAISGDPAWGIDFEAEVAVVIGDVARGATANAGAAAIRFVMLLNDVSLRNLIAPELSKGFGFVQSKPPSACSPFAVSPDDLPGWDGRRLHGRMRVDLNDAPFGRADAGENMTFDFGQLVAHAARTRPLPAGTVIGSGTISNRGADDGPGRPVGEGGRGYSCIAEQRMVEILTRGDAVTPFLRAGDRIRIWMEHEGSDIFGAIDQRVIA